MFKEVRRRRSFEPRRRLRSANSASNALLRLAGVANPDIVTGVSECNMQLRELFQLPIFPVICQPPAQERASHPPGTIHHVDAKIPKMVPCAHVTQVLWKKNCYLFCQLCMLRQGARNQSGTSCVQYNVFASEERRETSHHGFDPA